jgi:hypothetical protein
MIYRTPDGACYVATTTGPVQVLAAELTSMASPQIMQVSGLDRVQAYCPATPAAAAVKVDAAELAAALLAQPAFATALADAAFQGAQRAESE